MGDDYKVKELASHMEKLVDLLERHDIEHEKRMERLETSLETLAKTLTSKPTGMERMKLSVTPAFPVAAASPLQYGDTSSAAPMQLQNQASTFKDIANAFRRLKESVEIRDVVDEEFVTSCDLSLVDGKVDNDTGMTVDELKKAGTRHSPSSELLFDLLEPEDDENLLLVRTESRTRVVALEYEIPDCKHTLSRLEVLQQYFINRVDCSEQLLVAKIAAMSYNLLQLLAALLISPQFVLVQNEMGGLIYDFVYDPGGYMYGVYFFPNSKYCLKKILEDVEMSLRCLTKCGSWLLALEKCVPHLHNGVMLYSFYSYEFHMITDSFDHIQNIPICNLYSFMGGERIHTHWIVHEAISLECSIVFDIGGVITSCHLTSSHLFSPVVKLMKIGVKDSINNALKKSLTLESSKGRCNDMTKNFVVGQIGFVGRDKISICEDAKVNASIRRHAILLTDFCSLHTTLDKDAYTSMAYHFGPNDKSMINGYLYYYYDCSILANYYHMSPNFSFVNGKRKWGGYIDKLKSTQYLEATLVNSWGGNDYKLLSYELKFCFGDFYIVSQRVFKSLATNSCQSLDKLQLGIFATASRECYMFLTNLAHSIHFLHCLMVSQTVLGWTVIILPLDWEYKLHVKLWMMLDKLGLDGLNCVFAYDQGGCQYNINFSNNKCQLINVHGAMKILIMSLTKCGLEIIFQKKGTWYWYAFLHMGQLMQKVFHSCFIVQLTTYLKRNRSCGILVLEDDWGSFIFEGPCNCSLNAEQWRLKFLKTQSGKVHGADLKELQEDVSTATMFKLFPFDPGGATSSLSTFMMGYVLEILIHYAKHPLS